MMYASKNVLPTYSRSKCKRSLPSMFYVITRIFSKWSSSSSTPRPSTVTDASRPRRRRTSSSAPLPPSSPRLKARKLRRTRSSVHLLARTRVTSHRGHCIRGLVTSGGCLSDLVAFGWRVLEWAFFSLTLRWFRGGKRRLFAGGFFRTRVYPASSLPLVRAAKLSRLLFFMEQFRCALCSF